MIVPSGHKKRLFWGALDGSCNPLKALRMMRYAVANLPYIFQAQSAGLRQQKSNIIPIF